MKKPQVTTTIGTAGIFTQFLTVFNNVRAVDFVDYIQDMTCGEIYTVVMPIVLYGWAIWHNEDGGKDGQRTGDHSGQSNQINL